MKVLVATRKTQGMGGKLDFFWAKEGELVTFGMECDGEKWNGSCGCKRALAGVESMKGTTTFMVEDRAMSRKDLEAAIADHLKRGGWFGDDAEANEKMVQDSVSDIVQVCKAFKPGAILERRGCTFRERLVQEKPNLRPGDIPATWGIIEKPEK